MTAEIHEHNCKQNVVVGSAESWSSVQDNTGRLLRHMDTAGSELDSLFAELEVSLAESRQIFGQIADSNGRSASNAADSSSAASLSQYSHAADMQSADEAADQMQIPTYVHIGDPLVTEQPRVAKTATGVCSHEVYW